MIPTLMFRRDIVELCYWLSLLLLFIITLNVKTDLPNRRPGTKILDINLDSLEIIIITLNVKMIVL